MRAKMGRTRLKKYAIVCMAVILTAAMMPLFPEGWVRAATVVQPAVTPGAFMVPVTQETTIPDGYTGIYDVIDLDQVRTDLDGKYILMADIDFSSEETGLLNPYENVVGGWLPIGDETSPFTGDFDGNGHKIIGLLSNNFFSETDTLTGLFGVIGSPGSLRDLHLERPQIIGDYDRPDQYVAPFAARLIGGTIENCFVDGISNTIGNEAISGGIVGEADDGAGINFCYNTFEVTSENHAGGIAGVTGENCTISHCINFGLIYADSISMEVAAGGMTSVLGTGSVISECYNQGEIHGRSFGIDAAWAYGGGMVGLSSGHVRDSFNRGPVDGSHYLNGWAGGLVGYGSPAATLADCYNTGEITGSAAERTGNVAGGMPAENIESCYYMDILVPSILGLPLSPEQMATQSSFAGFDFTDTWVMGDDITYVMPCLKDLGKPYVPQNTTEFAGGDGGPHNPYQLSNLNHLKNMYKYPEAYFIMTQDIAYFPPVGGNEVYTKLGSLVGTLSGGFDGNGHTISGISFSETDGTTAAMFKKVGGQAVVRDLNLLNCEAKENHDTAEFAALIAGELVGDSSIINCTASGIVAGTTAGGLVAKIASTGTITNCSFTGTVNGQRAGGILASGDSTATIENCTNHGMIVGNGFAGGIAGSCTGVILNCINDGAISAVKASSSNAGGIAGYSGYVEGCHNKGTVYAGPGDTGNVSSISARAGGISGSGATNTMLRCSNTGTVTAGLSPSQVQPVGIACLSQAGGLIGYSFTSIKECWNSGPVRAYSTTGDLAREADAGGLTGVLVLDGNNLDSYNTGSVTAQGDVAFAGGLCGYMNYLCLMDRCLDMGQVSAQGVTNSNAGGLAGSMNAGNIQECFQMDGIVDNHYGQSYPQTNFMLQSCFPFDFVNTWKMDSVSCYPILRNNPQNAWPIVYHMNGGILPEYFIHGYLTGSPQKLPLATRTGYQFGSWYMDNPLTAGPVTATPDQGATALSLYAKWTPNSYNIKFAGNGASSGTMAALPMTYNTSKALSANSFKKNGYAFLGWAKSSTGPVVYKDKASVKNLTTTNKGTVTLYAKWGPPIQSAVSNSYNSIKVTWAYAGNATSYKIYQSYNGGTFRLVHTASASSRSWVSTGLKTGVSYFYRIYPVAGGKTYSHSDFKYTKPIPATPTVTLSKYSSTSIKVSWTGVSGATKYQIFRANSATGTYSYLYTASSTARSWVNTGLTPGKTYYYKVRAYHLEGTTKVYGASSAVKYLKL